MGKLKIFTYVHSIHIQSIVYPNPFYIEMMEEKVKCLFKISVDFEGFPKQEFMYLCMTHLICTKYHSKCQVHGNEDKTNSQFSSFLDLTSHIAKQSVYLYLCLLKTEHPTQTDLNRREMNLLIRLEIQKYCRYPLDTPCGFSLSCLLFLSFMRDYSNSGPHVNDRKVQREKDRKLFLELFPEEELFQTIAFHISM